jgi:dihydroflavonol-4-reductase
LNNKKIFVTGASGFLGSHCIIDLLKHNYQVVGTIRDMSREKTLRKIFSRSKLDNDKVSFKKADLKNPEAVLSAMNGCDGIFHVASPVPIIQPKTRNEISEIINVAELGTLNVLKAAVKQGVDRVILTSSIATIYGSNDKETRFDYTDWADPEDKKLSPYALSKVLAERTAWDFCQNNSIDLTTIHPTLVLGPALEPDYGTSLEAIAKILKGDLPMIPNFGFEIVDVRDVASLHRIAIENPNSVRNRLIASKDFMWFKRIAEILDSAYPNRKIPKTAMPNILSKAFSILIPELKQITKDLGKEKRVETRNSIRLGWRPRDLEDTIIASAESLISLRAV